LKKWLSFLDEDQLQCIHSASLKVLEDPGVRVMHEEVLEILEQAGAKVNFQNQIAYMPSDLVEKCLRKCPKSFILAGRSDKYDLLLAPNGSTYVRSTGGPEYILDIDTEKRRKITTKDLIDYTRLIDAFENIHYCKSVFPNDVPLWIRDIYLFEIMLENTSKHITVQPYTGKNSEYLIKLASTITGGKEKLRERPITSFYVSAVSPLQYDKEAIEIIIKAGEYGIPVMMDSTLLAGATGPVAPAGLMVLMNAEILAGIVISQLMHPGAPIIYSPRPYVCDMRTLICAHGYAENALVSTAITQLVRKLYEIPIEVLGPATDSKIVDGQAMIERVFPTLMVALAGANLIAGPGNLESSSTISPIQLAIDDDILGMIFRILDGILIDEDRLASEVIKQVGPGGCFLREENTLKYFRSEYFFSQLCDRNTRNVWEKKGSKDIVERAREKVKKILREYVPIPLEKCVVKELKSIVEEAKRSNDKRA